ncbi:MAG: DUF357 domain-containing protein [Candidatus Diapherotrites archaeon]|nr:DUF357 domain-containing protein [Candidatus Diapherotrites archaeon]
MGQSCEEKYTQCLAYTEEALGKLKVVSDSLASEALLKFARDYYNDAKHYAEKGNYTTALEAVAYAHGFIDAGVLSGYFKIKGYHLKGIKE